MCDSVKLTKNIKKTQLSCSLIVPYQMPAHLANQLQTGLGAVLADDGEAREGRRRVFGRKLRFLDQKDVDLLQLLHLFAEWGSCCR